MKQNLRKIYLICLFTLITAVVGASNDGKSFISYPGGKCYMFRVTLRDKAESPYSLDKPRLFLSEAALKRRERQHLQLDSTDLPVSPTYIQKIR